MQLRAGLLVLKDALARALHLAGITKLRQHLFGDRRGARLRATGIPCLPDGADFVAEAEARELLGIEAAHPRRVKRDGAGLRGFYPRDVFGDYHAAGSLDLERIGIASRGLRDRAEFRDRFSEARHRDHQRQPPVGLLRGELDALLIERRNKDRDVLADRREAHSETAAKLENLAVIIQRRPRHDHINDVDVLLQPRQRWIEFDAVKMLDDLRTAGAESDDHAPTG